MSFVHNGAYKMEDAYDDIGYFNSLCLKNNNNMIITTDVGSVVNTLTTFQPCHLATLPTCYLATLKPTPNVSNYISARGCPLNLNPAPVDLNLNLKNF